MTLHAHRAHLADLEAEARFRRERYDLYRAKVYGPHETSPVSLRRLKEASERAQARLTAARVRNTE